MSWAQQTQHLSRTRPRTSIINTSGLPSVTIRETLRCHAALSAQWVVFYPTALGRFVMTEMYESLQIIQVTSSVSALYVAGTLFYHPTISAAEHHLISRHE
jgi:hypothetical protein